MSKEKTFNSYRFYGVEVSNEGKKRGYIDYYCILDGINTIFNSFLIDYIFNHFCCDLVNGLDIDEDGEFIDFARYCITDEQGFQRLKEWTDIPVFYCEELNTYIIGIKAGNISLDYVLTDIKIVMED